MKVAAAVSAVAAGDSVEWVAAYLRVPVEAIQSHLGHQPDLPEHRSKPRCGTDSGYNAHRRRREPYCDACRAAHSVAVAEYYARVRSKRKQEAC